LLDAQAKCDSIEEEGKKKEKCEKRLTKMTEKINAKFTEEFCSMTCAERVT